MVNRKRVIFFDVLRILGVLMVAVVHYLDLVKQSFFGIPLAVPFVLPILGRLSWAQIGVYIMIFVSGAALAYTYRPDSVRGNLGEFYFKRFARIYPAGWVAFLFALIIFPLNTGALTILNTFAVITQTTAWFGLFNGPGGYWFLGLILSLYLMYPFIDRFISWQPEIALYSLIAISIISEIVIWMSGFWIFGIERWFPLCNLGIFGAGIYCVRRGFYPKFTTENTIFIYLAEVSFFVYLYHYYIYVINPNPLWFCVFSVMVASIGAMLIDGIIQKKVRALAIPAMVSNIVSDWGLHTKN